MFFLTFFFFGSSDSSTNSDTYSGAAHFWAGFLDRTGLMGVLVGALAGVLDVLVDLGAGFFFMTELSTLSSGKGSVIGGPELRVRGHGRGAARGTLGKVVVSH